MTAADLAEQDPFFRMGREPVSSAKLAAGRPQDITDADAIRKATASQVSRPAKKGPKTGRRNQEG